MKQSIAIFLSYMLIVEPFAAAASSQEFRTKLTNVGKSHARAQALSGVRPTDPASASLQDLAREWGAFRASTRTTLHSARFRSSLAAGFHSEIPAALDRIRAHSRSWFAQAETHLRRNHLEAKLPLLRDAQRQFENRFSEAITAAGRVGFSSDAEAALDTLLSDQSTRIPAPVISSVPSGTLVRSEHPGQQTPPMRFLRPARALPHDDSPSTDDLAASEFVQITPAMKAQANELGNSPQQIYAFVRNRVSLLTHRRLMQNSSGVLDSKSGNPTEQATLLIALLRAANIPARYASGVALIPLTDAQSWTGTLNAQGAESVIANMTQSAIQGDTIAVSQIWAQAWVDMGSGPHWVDLDPSFKPLSIHQGVSIAPPAFDRIAYLQKQATVPADEVYLESIASAVQAQYPGLGVSDASVTTAIVPDNSGELPSALPYDISGAPLTGAALISSFAYQLNISVTEATSSVPLLAYSAAIPSVAQQSIVLSWAPSTPADAQLIQSYGGLDNAPAFLVHLTPQLLLNGSPVQTGTGAITPGSQLNVNVGASEHQFQMGGTMAICLSANQISEAFLESRMDAYLAAVSARTVSASDPLEGEMLSIAGWRYFSRVMTEDQRVAAPLQLGVRLDGPSEGATISGLQEIDLFGKPLVITPASTLIDVKGATDTLYDLSGRPLAVWSDAARVAAMTSSSLEHELWEELVFTPGISTIKGLYLAYQNNIPVLDITKTNESSAIASLQGASASLIQEVKQDVDEGYEVLINQAPVHLNNWTGFVWIEENPPGYGYIISSSAGGGESTESNDITGDAFYPGTTGDPETTYGKSVGCNPVTLSNGNMYHQLTDFDIADPWFPLDLTRTYNSQTFHSGPFGYGWTHTYNQSVREAPEGVYYIDGSGTSSLFARSGASFTPPPYLFSQLTKDSAGYTIRTKDGISYRFDANGIWQTETDRNGNVLRLTHDSGGNLSTVTAPSGRSLTFSYSTGGLVSSITDNSGRVTRYTYDSAGNLASSADPAGNTTKYAYLSQANLRSLTAITFPEGDTIQYEYYSNHKIAKTIDRGGSELRFYYLPLQNQTMLIDYLGLTTIYEYNGNGNIVKTIKPDGNTVSRQVNAAGQPISETNELGFTTTVQYDSLGNILSTTDALGGKRQFTYDPVFNKVTSSADALGNKNIYSYDAKGNLTSRTDPNGNTISFTYDSTGRLVSSTDGNGNMTKTTWTGADLTGVTTPLGNTTELSYDPLGRVTGGKDALGSQSTRAYNLNGNVVSQTDPLNLTSTFSYNGDAQLVSVTDPLNHTQQYGYDGAGRITATTDPAGNISTMSYVSPICTCSSPEPSANSYTDPNGGVWKFSYDYRGLQTSSTDPLGNTTRLDYDAAGRLIRSNAPDGTWITYQYDGVGRLLNRTQSTGQADQFSYTANGDIAAMENQNVRVTNTYDPARRLISATDSRFSAPLTYGYDRAGHVTTLTTPAGPALNYAYDPDGRLTRVSGLNSQSASISYDADGRRSRIDFSNGTVATYGYDASNRITSVQHVDSKGAKIAAFNYVYDNAGNRTAVTDASGTEQYSYDSLDQLTGVTYPGGGTETYSYDHANNRVTSGSDQYSYDAATELIAAAGIAYTYDQRGNVLKAAGADRVISHTYDSANNLIGVQQQGGLSAQYKYDPLGRRIEKIVDGQVTDYLYDGLNLLQTANSTGSQTYATGNLDDLLFLSDGSNSLFAHQDGLQSVVGLSDASGSIISSWQYSAFGASSIGGANSFTAFRFSGRELDGESGYYYFRARSYYPDSGRFLQRDPDLNTTDGKRFSRYSFVKNNPLRYSDPTGFSAFEKGFSLFLDQGASAAFQKAAKSDNWLLNAGISFLVGGALVFTGLAEVGAAAAIGIGVMQMVTDPSPTQGDEELWIQFENGSLPVWPSSSSMCKPSS